MEKIECAAILDQHGRPHYISRPARHPHIIWWMKGVVHERIGSNLNHGFTFECCEQGFMTDTGRFVGREEAKIIAIEANQLLPNHSASDCLFSEDLW